MRERQPKKLTPKVLGLIYRKIARGLTTTDACRFAGVSRRALDYYQQSHPEVKTEVNKARAKRIDRHLSTIEKAATTTRSKPGDWRAAAWFLERTEPDKYGKRAPDQVTPQAFMSGLYRMATELLSEIPAENRERAALKIQSVLNDPTLLTPKKTATT